MERPTQLAAARERSGWGSSGFERKVCLDCVVSFLFRDWLRGSVMIMMINDFYKYASAVTEVIGKLVHEF